VTCDDVELTLGLAAMGEVDEESLREAREHALECAQCAAAERQYAEVFDLMGRAAVPDGPPPELRRRVLESLQPRGAAAAVGGTWWRRMWERVPSGRPLTVAGMLGSAAAVALAAVLVVGSRGPASVVNEPVQVGVNQPGVAGTLTYFRPTGDALLSMRGLAAAAHTPSGAPAVYELWLMRGDGRVAPAGVLAEQPDGTWSAVVHRGGAAQVAVAATLEPAPGTQAPTGAEVFQASLPGA
jgi:hypothetical protein